MSNYIRIRKKRRRDDSDPNAFMIFFIESQDDAFINCARFGLLIGSSSYATLFK